MFQLTSEILLWSNTEKLHFLLFMPGPCLSFENPCVPAESFWRSQCQVCRDDAAEGNTANLSASVLNHWHESFHFISKVHVKWYPPTLSGYRKLNFFFWGTAIMIWFKSLIILLTVLAKYTDVQSSKPEQMLLFWTITSVYCRIQIQKFQHTDGENFNMQKIKWWWYELNI